MALQDNTKLAAYSWNRIICLKNEEDIAKLNAGGIMFVRGNLIHAGMATSVPVGHGHGARRLVLALGPRKMHVMHTILDETLLWLGHTDEMLLDIHHC